MPTWPGELPTAVRPVILCRVRAGLFVPAYRANEARRVPNLHAMVGRLLGEHLRGELSGVFNPTPEWHHAFAPAW
jgi:hypothetical protein